MNHNSNKLFRWIYRLRKKRVWYNTMVLNKCKVVLFKTPKVASASLGEIFMKAEGKKFEEIPFFTDKDEPKYKDYLKIAFVRNSWERLVSHYNHKSLLTLKAGFKPNMSFKEFVEVVCNTPDKKIDDHARSQYLSFYREDCLANLVVKYEHLKEDIKKIFKKAGLKEIELPHFHKGKEVNYKDYYTPKLINKVRERYAKDIKLFGYTFEKE